MVKVKQLVWVTEPPNSMYAWGVASAYVIQARGTLTAPFIVLIKPALADTGRVMIDQFGIKLTFATIEAARQACQQDYECDVLKHIES